jgi:hypothetical protein
MFADHRLRPAALVLRILGLALVYLVLFVIGTQIFALPSMPRALTPEEQRTTGIGLVALSLLDAVLITVLVRQLRFSGWKLALMVMALFYGMKTFTAQIEAWYFMPNVNGLNVGHLMGMTLPVSVGVPLLATWLLRRWKPDAEDAPVWRIPSIPRGELWMKIAFISAIVYPVLFFSFGYFVAWQSPAVREFYSNLGSPPNPSGFLAHQLDTFSKDPFVYFFEVMRGALWVAFALPILWAGRGSERTRTLLVATFFALIENDSHLLPNPLMVPEVRAYHFIETASSNFLLGLITSWLLLRSHPFVARWFARRSPQLQVG